MRGLLARPPAQDSSPAIAAWDEDALTVVAAQVNARDFAPLYSRYFDQVYRYCYRRLGHPEAAADATGQIFAKALAGLPGYRSDAVSFRSWLFAIAHNVLVDEVRAWRPTTNLETVAEMASRVPSPEEELLKAEAGWQIRDLLARLPPEQRQVMELRLAGLTGPEIAAAVDRSLGSVKIAQVRAIGRMRTALGVDPSKKQEAQGDER